MKAFLFIGALCAVPLLRAQTCNDTFSLQAAVQTMRSGSVSNLQTVSKNLQADLSDLDTLPFFNYRVDTLMNMTYRYPLGFKPNCTDTATPAKVTYWERTHQTTTFSKASENYPRIQLFDSTEGLQNHPEFWEWLAFFRDNTSVFNYYLGRTKTGAYFENWYGNAYLDDSVKDTATGYWSDSISYLPETEGPLDSAKLDSAILITNGWVTRPVDANHRPYLYIQTVKLSFGTGPSEVLPALSRAGSGFAAWQQDRLIWIRAGGDVADRGEPLQLFNMFGRKTALLYPSGYLYSWNGKSRSGQDAAPGVYFVRSRDHILGKFVYTR